MHKPIALLSTGTEIQNGDILNTNAQHIAHILFENQMTVGNHMTVSDDESDIYDAIKYLLSTHDAIIITGGLGPTSDDRTRYALAKTLGQSLEFHEPTWAAIKERILNRYGYVTLPESNRQQALFPKEAIIYPNPLGSAAGCQATLNSKSLFMLPGPPTECIGMFQSNVLPYLLKQGVADEVYFKKWLLFGVSEGEMAEQLDALLEEYDCTTGYRIAYPYVEFKISAHDKTTFDTVCPSVMPHITPYLVGDGVHPASQQFAKHIKEQEIAITFQDDATGGKLQQTLLTPETFRLLSFGKPQEKSYHVTLSGLKDYWETTPNIKQTTLSMSIIQDGSSLLEKRLSIPMREARTPLFAMENLCIELLQFFNPKLA